MDFDDARWNAILTTGQFAADAVAVYGSTEYPVRVIKSAGYSRKRVDGQKVSDEPLGLLTLTIHASEMPSAVTRAQYALLKFELDGVLYIVKNFWGYSVLRFVLKAALDEPADESLVDPDDFDCDETVDDGLMEL